MEVARLFLLRPGNEASIGSMFANLGCVGQCNRYKKFSSTVLPFFIMQDDVSSDESYRSEGTSSDSENEYDRLRRKNIEELAAFRENLGLVYFIPFIIYYSSCIFQPAFSKVDSLLTGLCQLTANESSEKEA